MYPAKAAFQVLKRNQESLFIFTFAHRKNNSWAVKLVSASCPHGDRCPSTDKFVCLGGELTCVPTHSNPSSTVLFHQKPSHTGRNLHTCSVLPSRSIWLQSPPASETTHSLAGLPHSAEITVLAERSKAFTRVWLCGPCSCELGKLQSETGIKSTDSPLWFLCPFKLLYRVT